MQCTSNSDEDHLYQSLPVVFLVLLLFGLAACEQSSGNACSSVQVTILFACIPPSLPQHTHNVSHPHTRVKKFKPAPGPLPPPTPAPTPSPIPSPASPIVTRALIIKIVNHYIDLVLKEHYKEAYAILSAALRAQEPFADFVKNPNYTLSSGCWKISDIIMASPLNGQHGVANIQLTQVSCSGDSPIAYYDWVFHFHMEQGHLVLVSLDLYPAAPANE